MLQTGLGRTLAAALLVLTLANALAGCAGGDRADHGLDPDAPIDPERDYHLVVWEYQLPFVSPGGAPFAEAAGRAIRRFRERHPNATVDLVLLDPADGEKKLAEALQAGYPPDVYCTPYGPPAVGSRLQIPIGPFLDYDVWADYHPVAWQAVKVGDVVWAWPRWLVLWPWLANRDAPIAAQSWTWDDLAGLAGSLDRAGTAAGPLRVALGAPDPAVVLRDLLFGAHLAAGEAPTAEAFWSGGQLGAALEWLAALRDSGALDQDLTGKNPGVMDSFIHGRTALLAPPSPWATMFLAEMPSRQDPWQFKVPSRENRPPVAFVAPPAPTADEVPAAYVSAGQVQVFRQARYRGDDHTRLAVELAREISREARIWLREHPLCVPVVAAEVASWRKALERYGTDAGAIEALFDRLAALPTDRLSRAFNALDYGPWPPRPGHDGLDQAPDAVAFGLAGPDYHGPLFTAVLAPVVREFWDSETTTEAVLPVIITALGLEAGASGDTGDEGQSGD